MVEGCRIELSLLFRSFGSESRSKVRVTVAVATMSRTATMVNKQILDRGFEELSAESSLREVERSSFTLLHNS